MGLTIRRRNRIVAIIGNSKKLPNVHPVLAFHIALLHSGMTGLAALNWPAIALAAVLLVCTNWVPVVKKWHPIVFIGISALVGVLLKF